MRAAMPLNGNTADMNGIMRLDPKAYRRTPWKNGGGVTIDIADDYASGVTSGSWSGMLWRFGRTRIETPGPFSDLSGFDRILTVIGGRGLTLTSRAERRSMCASLTDRCGFAARTRS